MNPQPKPLGRLSPESEQERRAAASIGKADVAELKSRTRRLNRIGGVLQPGGEIVTTPANLTRRLLLGDEA
jgi:hypothetical protein